MNLKDKKLKKISQEVPQLAYQLKHDLGDSDLHIETL
jgi:hypothetical protein